MEPKAGDIVFVDTNILLAATDRDRPQHQDAQRVIARATNSGIHLALSGQILREYLVVATRPPDVNGLGLSTSDALGNVEEFLHHTVLYEETEDVSVRLREVTKANELTGKRIHDANIVATMLAHGLPFLLTMNPDDFKAIPGIQLVELAELAHRTDEASPDDVKADTRDDDHVH